MKKIITANWKMMGSQAMVEQIVPAVASFVASTATDHEVVICPPAVLLPLAAQRMQGGFLALGAQDCSPHEEGAYTGEISARMLKGTGCRYVIVGHSERRHHHGETDAEVRAKAEAAISQGIIPIICVGETQAEREAGQEKTVVSRQLSACLPSGIGQFLLAYEPVWAIGSGKTPAEEQIADMHAAIVAQVGALVKVLYGGSVKAANAADIMRIAHVSGVLVGGASLNVDEFCGIIAAAER